ncbi:MULTISPECIES: RICIN domain-containing protein [Streptomyces]|uniref:Ricin-type beta-trefoil lectin domain protein n=1 Tax=Streptomyces chartreusis NRRL 3882 TaxID=1079985 RepID=A0A2N9BKL6_STRCX|nr:MULTISPECIES: RICIN domain-containing protein [Streptomyces]MYS94722.1 alpha-glucosidase [Streptomyces sp. SID5464]SOR83883.1 Ricin-type beta-trefoil lectin domain protein [Streptomyces chartreusis NRRL 3882]
MLATRRSAAVAALLAGALLAAAGPAIAHTPSQQSDDPTPRRALATIKIKNLKSGKYLQAVSSANGAKVVQRSGNDSFLQLWETVLSEGGTVYSWENWQSKLNLGIDRASTSAGAAAITATPSGDLNQDWYKDWGVYDGTYYAMKNRKSGLCLGISGASTADGAAAAQFPCDGSANQGWVTIS